MLALASISLVRESSRSGGRDVHEYWWVGDVSVVEHGTRSEADAIWFDPKVHMA